MAKASELKIPDGADPIRVEKGRLQVPDHPIVPFIEGDGIGPDVWRATRHVLDASVSRLYGGQRTLGWTEIYAGEKSHRHLGSWLPDETLDALSTYKVGIKGPLTTPVGGGIRSLNVTLRQALDLYACIRPVRWLPGVPSPMREPEKLDVVIFRENTEDVYAGVEYQSGSPEADKVRDFLNSEFGASIREKSGIGIKAMSEFATARLVAKAIQAAIEQGRASVTLVHKGNIMKFTEGAFRDWGYDVARARFGDRTITEKELWEKHDGERPADKVVIKDRIADAMFQQVLLRPAEYDVIALPNLNGDYLSDACAAQVGGLGLAPGANLGDEVALFEATHGTAPKYAGQDKVNPGSLILSGVMMLEHLGWKEAGEAIVRALERAIDQGRVTYDLARQMPGATTVSTSRFAQLVADNLEP